MAVSDTLLNTLFDGRYRVVRKLGSGGMADVYLAEDQELGRRVAIKILNERHAADDQFIERFRREAKNAAGLSHPNIVSVYDRGESEGTYYIAMEYMEGRTLKELIVRDTLPIPVVIDYARQILAALRFAHRHGIVHRDIKPHNVLIGGEGRLKVTDFGIARAGASQMTEVGSIIGTAQYLSPEQAKGAPVDQRSDIYSLGVVLYELLTGVVPFSGDTPVEIAMKHLSSVPEPPSRKRPDVPRELDKVVLRALAKDPKDRYATADEMDADLARIERGVRVSHETAEAATAVLSGAGIDATAISRVPVVTPGYRSSAYYEYEAPRRRTRSYWPWLLALALVVAAGLAGWYAYTQLQEELNEAKPVTVPLLVSIPEPLAVQRILGLGLRERVIRRPNDEYAVGTVYDQSPGAGERIDRGNTVTVFVSLGKPRSKVPDVVGETVAAARAALAARRLNARVFEVFSEEPAGTVIAQDPKAGTAVDQGTSVRINISQGAKPLPVPPVIGQSFDSASAELQAARFAVARVDVDSEQPQGTVVSQDPDANTLQPRGSTVTLGVSKGPSLTTVPDVTGVDAAEAEATLENAGFRVRIRSQETSDPSQDGIVLDQDPFGGTEAVPGSTVTITVARAAEEEPPPETTPETTPPEDEPPPLP